MPDDVYVGIVTFDSDVETPLTPTQDRDAARTVLEGLTLAKQTSLYDGVLAAVDVAGDEGQRGVLVLSDGADTTDTELADVTAALGESDVRVDVVAIAQRGAALDALESMAEAGGGAVISADPAALRQAFANEAETLANQVLVTAQVPDSVVATEAEISVSLPTGAETLTAEAFTTIAEPRRRRRHAGLRAVPGPHPARRGACTPPSAWSGVGFLVLFGALIAREAGRADRRGRGRSLGQRRRRPDRATPRRRAGPGHVPGDATPPPSVLQPQPGPRGQDRGPARGSRQPRQGGRVAAHAARRSCIVAGVLGLLIGGGNLIIGLIFLVARAACCRGRGSGTGGRKRRKAFNDALPDTLQLMAGSLQAGLSLAQSVDTIVREGTEPIASEFKRVLVETRLGVSLEDALDGISQRFESKDFELGGDGHQDPARGRRQPGRAARPPWRRPSASGSTCAARSPRWPPRASSRPTCSRAAASCSCSTCC